MEYEITRVTDVRKTSDSSWELTVSGTFMLKGVRKEKQVTLTATYLPGKLHERNREGEGDLLVLRCRFVLDRAALGIQPDLPSVTVAREIQLSASIVGCATIPKAADAPSTARLVADVEWIQPGRPFRVGVLFEMQDQWHVYWINPGDSGMPPDIDWQLPDGFTAAAVQWPHPQRFDDPPFATFGHDGELLLAREIQPPAKMETGGTVTLTADADWLVCREICIPQQGRLSLQLDVRDEPPAPSPAAREAFARAAARIPVAAPGWRFAVLEDGNDYLLSVTPPSSVGMETALAARFFPANPGFLRTGPYRWREAGKSALLPLRRDGPNPAGNRLRGVLVLPEPPAAAGLEFPRAIVVDAPLPPASNNE